MKYVYGAVALPFILTGVVINCIGVLVAYPGMRLWETARDEDEANNGAGI